MTHPEIAVLVPTYAIKYAAQSHTAEYLWTILASGLASATFNCLLMLLRYATTSSWQNAEVRVTKDSAEAPAFLYASNPLNAEVSRNYQ